jgi:hypothetical protein
MHTERFDKLRKEALSKVFKTPTICNVWRNIVRTQLRHLDIKDIFDHYDFNYNIEERAQSIRSDILNGGYQVSLPLIYRIEKKFGICRHLIIPQPTDALALQVLVESVATKILDKQPSKNAFYSRDKHNVGKPHEAFGDYPMTAREKWKELQKKIYKFNEDKELIVVTDLTNYYDSISIPELRKVSLSYISTDEVVLDLLFRIIEDISWKPDYLPYSGKGLPTSNLEAIRLLAHSFLFEIDAVISQKTDNCFTRWMDDIVIGVDNKKKAIEILSSISDMLKSRGLALNISKTDIYDTEKAIYNFQIDENKYLDGVRICPKNSPEYNARTSELKTRFKKHYRDRQPKYWDKVAKRYITAFSKFGSPKLLTELSEAYLNCPALRPNLLGYLFSLGYRKDTGAKVSEIIDQLDVFDDISLFQICDLLTKWEIPVNDLTKTFLTAMDNKIVSISFEKKQPLCFHSVLWFKAKYSHPDELLSFLLKFANIWQTNSFLRRQVTAVMARLLSTKRDVVEPLLKQQISSGISNTASVANQILAFARLSALDKKLSWYLFPRVKSKLYPLHKFLVLCSVLNSGVIRSNDTIKVMVRDHVQDPYYRKWLDQQFNI